MIIVSQLIFYEGTRNSMHAFTVYEEIFISVFMLTVKAKELKPQSQWSFTPPPVFP